MDPTHSASQLRPQQARDLDLAHQAAHQQVCLATLERAPPQVSSPIRIMLLVAPNQQPLEVRGFFTIPSQNAAIQSTIN